MGRYFRFDKKSFDETVNNIFNKTTISNNEIDNVFNAFGGVINNVCDGVNNGEDKDILANDVYDMIFSLENIKNITKKQWKSLDRDIMADYTGFDADWDRRRKSVRVKLG